MLLEQGIGFGKKSVLSNAIEGQAEQGKGKKKSEKHVFVVEWINKLNAFLFRWVYQMMEYSRFCQVPDIAQPVGIEGLKWAEGMSRLPRSDAKRGAVPLICLTYRG